MYRKDVVMVTLTASMFLLFTCMNFWVWGVLRRWSTCAPTTYEVINDCWKFEKHWVKGANAGEASLAQLKCFCATFSMDTRNTPHLCNLCSPHFPNTICWVQTDSLDTDTCSWVYKFNFVFFCFNFCSMFCILCYISTSCSLKVMLCSKYFTHPYVNTWSPGWIILCN
jgi:hypothetical protein